MNFLIHIASGIFLYWFLLLTFNLPSLKEKYGSISYKVALFSSLIFISHPIQTQSVTYIVQRMASMAGMFYLLSLVLYVKGRLSTGRPRILYFGGMVLSYLLGVFSKENVAILPLFIALYEFYFFQKLDLSPKGRKILFGLVGALLHSRGLRIYHLGRKVYQCHYRRLPISHVYDVGESAHPISYCPLLFNSPCISPSVPSQSGL